MADKKTGKLTLGGICLALTMIFLFGATVVPKVELTLYAVSSAFIAVTIIEAGPKGGILLYVAAVLLGLLLLPDKFAILPYACLFGLYGIVKFYIEKIQSPIGQIVLKALFFGVVLAAGIFLFWRLIIGGEVDSGAAMGAGILGGFAGGSLIGGKSWLLVFAMLAGIALLFLYDVLYTLFIRLYQSRFHRQAKMNFPLSRD